MLNTVEGKNKQSFKLIKHKNHRLDGVRRTEGVYVKPASSRLEWKADGTETTSFGAGLPLPLNTEEAFIGRRQFEVICEKACLFVPSTAVFFRKLTLFASVFFGGRDI